MTSWLALGRVGRTSAPPSCRGSIGCRTGITTRRGETIRRSSRLSWRAERGRSFSILSWQMDCAENRLTTMPTLFRFLMVLWACWAARPMAPCMRWPIGYDPKPREITVSIPPDKFSKQHLKRAPAAALPRPATIGPGIDGPPETEFRPGLIDAVPRHAGGRARRRRQHACGLWARSRRLLGPSRPPSGRPVATADTDDVRGYLGALDKRGFAATSVARRLSAIRQLYRFLYAEGHRRDDPAAIMEGPKRGRTIPKVLSIAEVDRLLAAARARAWSGPSSAAAGAAAGGAARLPARGALRDRAAGLRAGRAAGFGGRAQCAHADRARQGRQGAHGAAQRGRQAGHARLSGAARGGEPAGRRSARGQSRGGAVRNGCFPPSARAAISPASISPAISRRSPPPPGCAPSR